MSSLSRALPQAAAAPPSPFSSSPDSVPQPRSASLLGPGTAPTAACRDRAQIVHGCYGEWLLCQWLLYTNGTSPKVHFSPLVGCYRLKARKWGGERVGGGKATHISGSHVLWETRHNRHCGTAQQHQPLLGARVSVTPAAPGQLQSCRWEQTELQIGGL